MNIIIRKSTKEDLPQVLDLIKELALYEKALNEVTNTVEDMINDGFRENPVYHCDVAISDQNVIGIAIYFIKYSTWKGRGIYLDDIIVTEKWRRKGIGRLLFNNVLDVASSLNSKYVHWQVLEWNQPAIEFYKKYNASFDEEWINCKINLE